MKSAVHKEEIDGIPYELSYKKVKNINVRVRRDGSVAVSAPLRCPAARVQAFLREKSAWIAAARTKALALPAEETLPAVDPNEALALFAQISAEIFLLFAPVLGQTPPALKVRSMKSRWGVCHIQKRQITLNSRLALYPRAVVEYVVLHEYAHFVHADHSAAFWAVVQRYMPDYKARRAVLRRPPVQPK